MKFVPYKINGIYGINIPQKYSVHGPGYGSCKKDQNIYSNIWGAILCIFNSRSWILVVLMFQRLI